MKTSLLTKSISLCFLVIFLGCRQQPEQPVPEDFGYLALSIKLEIEESTANGRLETVDISTFKVTIFTEDGTEYQSFEPFSSAPPEVQLPTGYYYVEAHSNNEAEAAFENPYYYGRSDVFGIDKEETTEIDVDVELANMKVAINYSAEVTSTFDRYSGAVTVNSTGNILPYVQGETREGYFAITPVTVTVDLSYDMLDGSTIDRTYTANIDDPQPKTLYTINVDAGLEDGVISFNINVDESFDEEIIEIGEGLSITTGQGVLNYNNQQYDLTTAYFGCNYNTDLGFYDCQILFSDGEPDLCSGNQIASIAGIGSDVPLDQLSSETFTFSTNNGAGENAPQEIGVFVWALLIYNIPGFNSECELESGYTLIDTDINGTTSGSISFEKTGEDFSINFNYSFLNQPPISGEFTGPMINLN